MATNDTYPYNEIEEFTAATQAGVTWANENIGNPLNALKDELGSGPKGAAADLTTRLAEEHNADGTHTGKVVLAASDIPEGAFLKIDGTSTMEGDIDLDDNIIEGMSYTVRVGWNAIEGASYQTRLGTVSNPSKVTVMTTAQRDALGSSANGLIIYNETDNQFEVYENGSWTTIGAGTLANHDHSGDAGDGGQLDWDDIWSDAVHSHESDAEGGTIAAAAISALPDHDHTGDAGDGGSLAHALLSTTHHSDAAADAVSRGSLIIGNSTPAWDELTVGAANKVVSSDGTDVSWDDVKQLQGRGVESGAPTSYEALTWNAASSEWQGMPVDAEKIKGLLVEKQTPRSYEALGWDVLNTRWKPKTLYYFRDIAIGISGAGAGTHWAHVVVNTGGPAATVVRARAYADTAPSGGACTVDINVGSRGSTGTSILSSALSIANGTKDSGVTTSFAKNTIGDGQEITVDIDALNDADDITVQLTIKVPLVM